MTHIAEMQDPSEIRLFRPGNPPGMHRRLL